MPDDDHHNGRDRLGRFAIGNLGNFWEPMVPICGSTAFW